MIALDIESSESGYAIHKQYLEALVLPISPVFIDNSVDVLDA